MPFIWLLFCSNLILSVGIPVSTQQAGSIITSHWGTLGSYVVCVMYIVWSSSMVPLTYQGWGGGSPGMLVAGQTMTLYVALYINTRMYMCYIHNHTHILSACISQQIS